MKKQTVLMRRVKKILESKNNKFKRKYFLLSTLASTNAKDNNEIMSEAECYANVLIESNGQKPSEECLVKLYEDSLAFSKSKNISKKVKFIKNYNNMINSKVNKIEESIIDEELSLISEGNYKVNEKLFGILFESIEKRTCILMESKEEEIISNAFTANPKNINLRKQGYESDEYVPGQPRLKAIDKAGQAAIARLESNTAKRKFEIIKQIHFYLNVQQKLNLAKIQGQGKADLTQSKEKFSSRPSGLSDDEVDTLRNQLDNMLLRNQNYESLNLDDDTIKEGELLALLFKSAGDRYKDAKDYLSDLDRRLPREKKKKDIPLEDDPDFETDMAKFFKDDEAYSDEVDPDTGEPLYVSADMASKLSQDAAAKRSEENQLPVPEEMSAETALGMLDQSFGSYDKVKQSLSKISPEISKMVDDSDFTLYDLEEELAKIQDTIDPEEFEELESLIDAINSNETINIKILPPKSKADIRSELYDTAATPEDFAYFVSKFVDTDKPLTLRDLGALVSHGEQGVASDANAVRQALTKNWFRAMFFSFDDDKKANIYATLADKWFYALELSDLFKDDVIKIPGRKDLSGSGAANYFDRVKNIMLRPNNIKKFLNDEFEMKAQDLESKGRRISDDDIEKNEIVDEMLTGKNGFRVFATSLMKDYYTNNVWNQCEQDLAYSIKEYFAKHYSSSNIGKDLPKGQKSRKVKKEQGKTFFDTIIYAVMGRTGIKDSKGTLATPDKMIEQRKTAFRNKSKFLDRVAKFNAEFPQNRLVSIYGAGSSFNEKDLDKLIDDMFSPSGEIGSTFSTFQKMSDEEYNNFVSWADDLKEQDIMLAASQALILSTASNALDLDEFMKPSMIKSRTLEAQGRLKEYIKAYKTQIDAQRKNLKIEDAEYVSYQGQKCEVDDIDMSKKIIHIYLPDDTLIKVPFDQVNLVK